MYRSITRIALATVMTAASLTVAVAAAPGAVVGPDFGPTTTTRALQVASIDGSGDTAVLYWTEAGRFRGLVRVDGSRSVIDETRDRYLYADGTTTAASGPIVIRRRMVAEPDRARQVDQFLFDYAWPLVARQRAGQVVLLDATLEGRPVLRGVTTLAANDCGALAAGTRTMFLDPATLVPVRMVERRGTARPEVVRFSRRAPAPSAFGAIRLRGPVGTFDEQFQRRGARQVAASVRFPVSLPTSLPSGFRFDAAGSAPRGAMLGPEGSFPRSRGVFQARWTRGIEHLDLTIRPAHGSLAADWDQSDPFGAECESTEEVTTTVDGAPARFAYGELGSPRLWWRAGSTLYTLAGPFSPDQLVAIASSLEPVTPAA